ncbi:MAG: ubiquinol-cytochrome c reductase iron-sulfur subunit [Planctomycetaceae bacterium]
MAKLTTAEKIALARQQGALGGGGDSSPPPSEPAAPVEPVAPAAGGKKLSPLELARQQGGGGGATPAATPPAGGKKLSPLEAARQQGAGAATGGKKLSPLEAARQQGSGGGGAPAKSAPKADSASQAASSPKAPVSVEGKSVKEMIEAARKPEAKSDGPKLPKLPKKPVPARKPMSKKSAPVEERRGILAGLVLTPFMAAWGLLGAATGAFTLGVARFMMPNVLVEPPTRFKIGTPADFPPETVITKFKAERGVWLINTASYNGQQMIYALASICTHLGCTPNWLEGEQKYKCPCHGSGFYKNGINFEGPAPRPLERVGIALAPDGQLEVDKSLKFQQEMGQWEDGASFVPV